MKKSGKTNKDDRSYLLAASLVNRSCFFENAPLPKIIPKLTSSVIPPAVSPPPGSSNQVDRKKQNLE